MINFIFYFLAFISILMTIFIILNTHPMYAILNLIFLVLTLSIIFFMLGAHFAGALEVIIYAGAITVLFVFVLMLLNLGNSIIQKEKKCLNSFLLFPTIFVVFIIFISILYLIIYKNNFKEIYLLFSNNSKELSIKLFGDYLIVVELISMLLLSSLIIIANISKSFKK